MKTADDGSRALKEIRARLRGDVITRLEMASREDPITHPEAAAYVAVVQAAVRYFEELDGAREVAFGSLGPVNPQLAELAVSRLRFAESQLRAVVGWAVPEVARS